METSEQPASGRLDPAAAVAEHSAWYHTIEVAPGVCTPGVVDLRRVAGRLLPDDLSGSRALDIGTYDGFWAFEMERRGAEVVAIDVDEVDDIELPPRNRARLLEAGERFGVVLGRGFRITSQLLGSKVQRVVCNVYDLTPEVIGGPVDFAFCGAIMVHLRDPVRALERVLATLVPGGELRQIEPFSPWLSFVSRRRPSARFQPLETNFNWWMPNLATLRAWPRTAGFVDVRRFSIVRPPATRRMRSVYAGMSSRRPS